MPSLLLVRAFSLPPNTKNYFSASSDFACSLDPIAKELFCVKSLRSSLRSAAVGFLNAADETLEDLFEALAFKTDLGPCLSLQQPTWRLWGEERLDGAVYTVYLKKVRYHSPSRSITTVSSKKIDVRPCPLDC